MQETFPKVVYDPWVHSVQELLLQERDVAILCRRPYRLRIFDVDWYSEGPIGAGTLDVVGMSGNCQSASG